MYVGKVGSGSMEQGEMEFFGLTRRNYFLFLFRIRLLNKNDSKKVVERSFGRGGA